ncbi:MAG: hypothetical protein Q9180_006146, partial [Flavoplaca navasiana]
PQLAGSYGDQEWTILPVKISRLEEDSARAPTVRCPASCQAAQAVFQATTSTAGNKVRLKGTSSARILVLDVAPINLTTIYVNVDGNALDRHEQIQREFGGGFGSFRTDGSIKKGKGKTKDLSPNGIDGEPAKNKTQHQESGLTAAVRSALGSCSVIRQGDFLPLPLPTHPITHVPLPPAKIICCEPVHQGLLAANTQIVVNRQNGDLSSRLGPNNHPSRDHLRYSGMEDGEESSAEHFFSANETLTNGHVSEDHDDIGLSESASAGDQSSSESGDSEDNTISLSAPNLSERPNGFSSSTIATPKNQSALHGTSTPGSVFSSFTARTTRQSSGNGRTFQACSLLAPIPIDLLHPRPADDEDDEARVYVDVKNLLKLRCFSGDWVKLQGMSTRNNLSDTWGLDAFDGANNVNDKNYRVVKVYGLPTATARSTLHHSAKELAVSCRASNVSNHPATRDPIHQAWLSPVLLANLSSPDEIRIIPMMLDDAQRPFSPKVGLAKAAPSNYPPLAAEVSLAKIASPISQESAMQEMLFLRLKQYFETRRRIVRSGDIIAVLVDVSTGRSLGPLNVGNENGQEMEDLLSLVGKTSRQHTSSFDVVWFMVGSITKPTKDKQETNSADDGWGATTSIDPAITRMTMSNNRQDRMPPSSQKPWRTYLGLAPRPSFRGSSGPMVKYLSTPPNSYVSTTQRRLRELMAAASSARAEHLGIEPTLILLHSTQRNIGKFRISTQAVLDLGLHSFSIDAYDIISEGHAGDVQESSINTRIARALSCGAQNTALIIRHLEALTSNRMVAALRKAARDIRILVATTTQLDQLPETLRSLFTHEIEMSAPDEGERKGILRNIIEEQGLRLGHDVDLAAVAVKTAALVAGNLVDIVDRAVVARQERLDGLIRQINGFG